MSSADDKIVVVKLTKIEDHRDEDDECKPCIKNCKEEDDGYEDVRNCWQNAEDYVTAKKTISITTTVNHQLYCQGINSQRQLNGKNGNRGRHVLSRVLKKTNLGTTVKIC